MKQILAIFDFCESIVSIQSISPYLELARKANSAYRSPNSYKQRLLRKAARLIYNANPRILEEEKEAEKDKNTTTLSDLAQDSRIFNKNAQNVFSPNAARRQDLPIVIKTPPTLNELAKDSRICDEKSGLFKDSQGRALGVRNRRESAEIADLSRKAESTSKLRFYLHPPTYPELAGLPLSTALSLAQSYALRLRAYSNQKVLDKLLWHKAQGHTIVVVSGGLGIYIRPFMQEFGIETILAVELESTFDKQGREILSGNRAGLHTMQERKLYALDNHLDLAQYDLPNSYAYSDCPSDVPLLSLVGKPCVIQGSQETRWAGILGYPILVP